jgi:fructose-bisphosphate aldolase class II
MTLVSSKKLLEDALKGKYAIPAFNVNNMEMALAIGEAVEETKSPIILQVSQGNIKYAGVDMAFNLVKFIADKVSTPVAIHLDHGKDFEQNIQCLRMGFSSLMFDGSKLSFDENVRITKSITDAAHACNVPVEAELGRVLGTEDSFTNEDVEKSMTNPDEALLFVEKTNIDFLAVALGNIHRMKEKGAELNINRLKEISSKVKIPLVLHGSSGVKTESIQEGIYLGLAKVNIATELNIAFRDGIKEYLDQYPDESDVRKSLKLGKQRVKDKVLYYLNAFDTINKA